jgi:hypothetical protein
LGESPGELGAAASQLYEHHRPRDGKRTDEHTDHHVPRTIKAIARAALTAIMTQWSAQIETHAPSPVGHATSLTRS